MILMAFIASEALYILITMIVLVKKSGEIQLNTLFVCAFVASEAYDY